MIKEKRILILEASPADADIAVRELRQARLAFRAKRVETKEAFLQSLAEFNPDIILSDYSLPAFGALDALGWLREFGADIPFVLFTRPRTDEAAVECMKEGAEDYVLKSNSSRLPAAVLRALERRETGKTKGTAAGAAGESDYRLRTLIENMSEGLLQVDDRDRIQFVNHRFCEMVGYTADELIGTDWSRLLHDEGHNFIEQINERRRKGLSDRYEIRLRKKSGGFLWANVGGAPIINAEGAVIGSMGTFSDITERKRVEEQLLHDAFHDGLTGLANRALFMDHLRLTIERGKRKPGPFAVLFLDFDRFKIINDSLGHSEGDNLLKQIAGRLKKALRPGDLLARLGGDEFTVLLAELDDESDASRVATRIQEELKTAFPLNGREVFISASIGIALGSSGDARAEDMLRDADTAMYRAKAKGKAQYQVFDQAMHEQALAQLKMETEIRYAVERGEFALHYQPIFELRSNNLMGFESLVRWNHPTRGLVSANEFIALAEETGLILPLGSWILRESCRQLRKWQRHNSLASDISISVNLSCKQFLQSDLAQQVTAILRETELPPSCLKFEITETYILENTAAAIAMMQRLRALGIEISLDDFGTGYSSLNYLHQLPLDYLKIDRSFIGRMTKSRENAEIVRTIIRLAQTLKMRVIAEGIETNDQLSQLMAYGCEFGQGYFFSKPLKAAAVALINSGKEKFEPSANT